MNILVIFNIKRMHRESELLFKHLAYWAGNDNNLWVISKYEITNKTLHDAKFVTLSKRLPMTITTPYWYLLSSHPRFDVVIDISQGFPVYSHFYTRLKTVYYYFDEKIAFLGSLNIPVLKRIIPLLFGAKYLLFSSEETKNKSDIFLNNAKIEFFVLQKTSEDKKFRKLKNNSFVFNLVFIDTNDEEARSKILNIFSLISRKNEGWNLLIFSGNIEVWQKKIGSSQNLSEVQNQIIFEKLNSVANFISKLPKNSIILDTSYLKGNIEYLITAVNNAVPFVSLVESGKANLRELKNTKVLYTSESVDEISKKIIAIVYDSKLLARVIKQENVWAKGFVKGIPEEESRKFLESI